MCARELAIEPSPDFSRLEMILKREGTPDRVPFLELFSQLQGPVLKALGKLDESSDEGLSPEEKEAKAWKQQIEYMLALGYDYTVVRPYGFEFPKKGERAKGVTPCGERSYVLADTHDIANRKDFENYPWPDMAEVDYSPFERIGQYLPEGMKVICIGPGGVLENAMWLLGYEGISYLLYDAPQLVQDVFDAVGSRIVEAFDKVASHDVVGAMALGDDIGFKTQSMLAPDTLREYLFPWHQKIVEAVHRHGKPIILHACGNRSEIMRDIVDCGWDGIHSFEDVIEPVWEVKEEWGDRIAVLGGFDMDKLSRMSVDEVRQHTRFLIEKCAPGGGWALGSGNSVANYIPVENFLAMQEEGYRSGVYGP
ncbi:MAG: uroporphyrinogen-III decarboxylase-like protein [Planctomycetes bacterium]|nr:uroporphyrinogen-III decarboxylase-like protein [Planctomycetota bacterium]